jgi:hypothetical protein
LTLATRLEVMKSGACVSAPLVASITLDTTFCSSHLQSALSISLAWNRGFRDACAAAAVTGRRRAGGVQGEGGSVHGSSLCLLADQ